MALACAVKPAETVTGIMRMSSMMKVADGHGWLVLAMYIHSKMRLSACTCNGGPRMSPVLCIYFV